MAIFDKVFRATNMALNGFRQGWVGPLDNRIISNRNEQYEVMRDAYEGTIFRDNRKWRQRLLKQDLHEKTLCLYNPTQRVVDFYAAHIYPGYLSSDGKPVAKNIPLAIPLSENTPENLRLAIAQLWGWSNWQTNMNLWITYCAMTGDGPVEIVDDVAKGKIYASVIWPGYIKEVTFDERDNVTSYTKEIQAFDEEKNTKYKYTRYVDKNEIRTYYNDTLHGFDGQPAVYKNIFGFCPFVWCKHKSRGVGIIPGRPAIRDWRKIEELNSDFTWLRMFIRQQAKSPQVLSGMGKVTTLQTTIDAEDIDIEDLLILLAENDGTVSKLDGNLNIEQALKLFEKQIKEIESDHPEIVMYSYLREMSQVTGPAAARLMGDVVHNVSLAQAQYDKESISLFRMMVAMAGYRANERAVGTGWEELDDQQSKFIDFDLDSFTKGHLDFTINPRPIITMTEFEEAEARRQRYIAYTAGIDAGLTLPFQLKKEGFSDEYIKELVAAREEEDQRKLAREKAVAEFTAQAKAKATPISDTQKTPGAAIDAQNKADAKAKKP